MTDQSHIPAVELSGLTHVYGDGTAALLGVDLKIGTGERVALLGPNGAGKSTLILHLNGVLSPTEGSAHVAGLPVAGDTLREVRSRVGLVFQDPDDQLFMTTVYEDVAFGPMNMGLPQADVDSRVHAALHAVGLAEVASKAGQHLSFGQRKRVALATVLSMRPEVLVLDEPTSNLDPRARRAMVSLISAQEATILVSTHDMDLAWEVCDRAVLMDSGRIVADGPASELMRDEELLTGHGLELPSRLARCP